MTPRSSSQATRLGARSRARNGCLEIVLTGSLAQFGRRPMGDGPATGDDDDLVTEHRNFLHDDSAFERLQLANLLPRTQANSANADLRQAET